MPKQSSVFQFVAKTTLPTTNGSMEIHAFRNTETGHEPIAIVSGTLSDLSSVPLRVHDACFTSEVLGSIKCDCNQQLQSAIEYIQQHNGIILYLHQEGRGIGLANKLAAYALQEQGLDTIEANRALHLPDDCRSYEDAARMLQHLNVTSVQLLTNNPRKIDSLKELGIDVTKRIALPSRLTSENLFYLSTKVHKMGHLIDISKT
jgi:GTP cyclohydrolase II